MKRSNVTTRWVVGMSIVGIVSIALNYRIIRPITQFFTSLENRIAPHSRCTSNQPCESNALFLSALSDLENVRSENEELREQLKFFKRLSYNQIVANVKSRDPLNQALLYIDAGAVDGVQVGQAVTADDGIMIGKISQVTPDSSLVELLTNDATRLTVRVSGASLTQGLLRGSLGSALRMEYVQADAQVALGDIIVTSGIEGGIPHSLVVGTVAKIVTDSNQLFTSADIAPALDYTQIRTVAVVRIR